MTLADLFSRAKPLIGMVHLLPLPGSPRFGGKLDEVIEGAVADALALAGAGYDGAIVENLGDAPFFPEAVPPETVAAMAVCTREVRRAVEQAFGGGFPIGVNVLRNDARAGLAVAAAAGAAFLRVNVHVGAAVSDQGVLEGRAHETMRARRLLCPDVLLLADLDVKHARPLGASPPPPLDVRLEELARRGLADAAIVTGEATGRPPSVEAVEAAAEAGRALGLPVLVGSGVTPETAFSFAVLALADGAIVGTATKRDGDVAGPVDPARAMALADAWGQARALGKESRAGAATAVSGGGGARRR